MLGNPSALVRRGLAAVLASIRGLRFAPSRPVLISRRVDGINIVRFGAWFYAVPRASYPTVPDQNDPLAWRDLSRAKSLSDLCALIAAGASTAGQSAEGTDRNSRRWLKTSPIALAVDNYRGYAIYRYEFKYFAIPADKGSFSYATFQRGGYGSCPIAHSLPETKRLIDRACDCDVNENNALVLGVVNATLLSPYIKGMDSARTDILWPRATDPGPAEFTAVDAEANDIVSWSRDVIEGRRESEITKLRARGYDKVILPWRYPDTWHDSSLEAAAAKISDYIEVQFSACVRRGFLGENVHRLIYNKAYLCSMFAVVPQPISKTVLEVGCSDGMVCEIFALLGASKVVGIDVMESVGCGHSHPAVEYHSMEADSLQFQDQSFDIVYSIATLEHVPYPAAVLSEIVRVLKPGGHAYVQAAPLYHSPFGHHMFAYFMKQPWIHLRRSRAEILAYAREQGIGELVMRDFGISLESYLDEMLNFDHVNGLLFRNYGLDEFQKRDDIDVLKFSRSYEGEELLTSDILHEAHPFRRDQLIEHGFEIAFRRRL